MNWLRTAQDGEAIEDAVRALIKKQPADPDAEAWLSHLAWLRQGLDSGTLEASMLTAEESAGLRRLKALQADMGKKFRACPRCGAMSESLLACEVCGASLVSGARGQVSG